VPLSLKSYTPTNGQEAWIYMVHLTGLSSIIGAINFIATIHNIRLGRPRATTTCSSACAATVNSTLTATA